MAGAAGSGFLQGFSTTSQALQKLQYDRDKDLEELQLKKEDLALRRDLLKGQEASRKLTDLTHQMTIQKFLEDQGKKVRATALLGPQPETGVAPVPGSADPPAVPVMPTGEPAPAQAPAPQLALPSASALPPATFAPTGKYPEIRQAIIAEATRQGVDPALALAVAQVESGLNPAAVGDGGKAHGVFQLHAPAALDARIDPAQRMDPLTNIRGGVGYIKLKLAQAGGDPLKAAELYNGGGDPQYVSKVQSALKQYANAPPGAGAPPVVGEPTSPLVRQPQGLPESPELTRLNTRIAALDASTQQINRLLDQSPDLRDEPRVKEKLDELRKDRTEAERQRAELVKEQTPAGLLQAYVKQYGLAEGTRLFEAHEIQKAREQQSIGLGGAAEKAAETERGKREEEMRQRAQKTILQVNAQTSRQYFDTATGKPLPQNSKQQDVDTRLGTDVVFLDDAEAKEYRQVQKLLPLLTQQGELLRKVYEPGGALAKLKPEDRLLAAVEGGIGRLVQSDKYAELTQLDRQLRGNVDAIGKGLKGAVGTQTEQDANRIGLLTAQVNGIPDSQRVAYDTYNFMLDTLNRMQGYYLGNDQFKHKTLVPLGAAADPRVEELLKGARKP